MKKLILTAIALAGLFATAFPQKRPAAVRPCEIGAYMRVNAPDGLAILARPEKLSKIVRRLDKGDSDISLEVIGATGTGWMKVTNAWHGEKGDVFTGQGWVWQFDLATGTKGYPNYDSPAKLYASMSKKSRVLKRIPSESEVILLDCAGAWAKVRHEDTTGWLAPENQCGNPFTSCS